MVLNSLSVRLWLLVLATVLPMLAMSVLDHRRAHQAARQALRDEIRAVYLAVQTREAQALDEVRTALRLMARANDLQERDPLACSGLAARLLLTFDRFNNLGAVLPDGMVFCSGRPLPPGSPSVSVVDRQWYVEALAANDLTRAEVVIGRISGQPGLVFGYPVRRPDGQLHVLLFAALQREWFAAMQDTLRLPEGWRVTVVDAQGVPLTDAAPARERQPLPLWSRLQPLAGRAPDESEDAFHELRDAQGRRLVGLLPLRFAHQPLYVVLEAPLERTLSAIDDTLLRRLALLAVLVVGVVALARLQVHRLVERWLARLQTAVADVAAGRRDVVLTPRSPLVEFAAVETGLERMVQALGRSESELRLLQTAIEQSPQSVVITDAAANIVYVNRAFERISGYPAHELLGRNPRLLNRGRTPRSTYTEMWATLTSGQCWSGVFHNTRRDGTPYDEEVTIAPVRDANGTVTHYVGIKVDVTERLKAQQRVHELSYYDQLTGLPNRALLLDRLRQSVLSLRRHGGSGALLLVDIDRFKHINDVLGHDAGDAVLREMAQRLQQAVRHEDTVARLGDDAFAVVLSDLSDHPALAAAHAERLAHKLQAEMLRPFAPPGAPQPYYATVSIGLTVFSGAEVTPESLLKQAEVALFRVKEEGRNGLRFYHDSMQEAVRERVAIEQGLREALVHERFRLHLQPQADATGRIVGAEVLLRWLRDDGQLVAPGVFIDIAEETGLIVPIGRWVLRQACELLARWDSMPRAGTPQSPLALSVNVSSRQFRQPDFVDDVLAIVRASGADPRRLVLEVTESVFLGDLDDSARRLQALRAHGIQISLDDFGTGYSSLSYLRSLQVDEVKIDQSFVRSMLHDRGSDAIVRAVIALSNTLGLRTVAEGVETPQQRDYLLEQGCRVLQGYLIGRPTPCEQWASALPPPASGAEPG
ncbi:putative signaling protein [Tepidimonas thermarum]|uniref:Putative signaling protein n=1 Tax=Tepidimonas thermarum TaxID=335431 RepID=A0A554X7N1_9BURK|nr:EAL domain-containing protein [Tepidimonas thermarum]TSE31839.1 putative signaling protein [Tepidimonas thermarum]